MKITLLAVHAPSIFPSGRWAWVEFQRSLGNGAATKTKKLSATKVLRAGRTAKRWSSETTNVTLGHCKEGIVVQFSMRSKGGGVTQVYMKVGPDDFGLLVSAMMATDRERAMREMSAAVASEIARQQTHDRKIATEARRSVVDAAARAFNEAPQGRDHAERLTRDMVRELVEKLNQDDASPEADDAAWTPGTQTRRASQPQE